MFNKRAANTAVVFGLVLVVVLVVIIYFAASGNLGNLLGRSNSTSTTPTTFSTTAALDTSPILVGHSSNIIFTYFNPFDQFLTANVTLEVFNPTYITATDPSKLVSMPADMSTAASGEFNVTCVGSSSSTSTFALSFQNFWQNATTSVETYPYDSTPLQVLPLSVSAGFLSVVANPITIETQLSSVNEQTPLNVAISPFIYNGEPFIGSTKGLISELVLSISNSTGGIASANVSYNLNTYSFSKGSTLTLTLKNVNLALLSGGGFSIEVAATNVGKPTQNLVNVDAYYNYEYSFDGPEITCQ